jgi:hypothetical protein
MMSRLISSRSLSSASMVKPIPAPFASNASASHCSINDGTQRAYCATSYRGWSADSLTEIECSRFATLPTARIASS